MKAADWLRERHPQTPASLAERMQLALKRVEASSATPVWQSLAEAAQDRLRVALPHAEERPAALDLLAADALLTHACEAAAEEGADALETLTTRYGATRLAELLTEADERA